VQFLESLPLWPLWPLLLFTALFTYLGYRYVAWAYGLDAENADTAHWASTGAWKLFSGTATGLFILLGFTISVLWTTFNAEIMAVNGEVQTVSRIIWTSEQLDDDATLRVKTALKEYLEVATSPDGDLKVLAQAYDGKYTRLPSTDALRNLANEIGRSENYTDSNRKVEATLLSQLSDVVSAREEIATIKLISMPNVLKFVLLGSAAAVCLLAGAMTQGQRGRVLIGTWVLSVSLSLSLAFWLDDPFSGVWTVKVSALRDLAESLPG
jgi:hypothetical protein